MSTYGLPNNSQNEYLEDELHLSNLLSFFDEVTPRLNERGAGKKHYFDHNKVFDRKNHCLLMCADCRHPG